MCNVGEERSYLLGEWVFMSVTSNRPINDVLLVVRPIDNHKNLSIHISIYPLTYPPMLSWTHFIMAGLAPQSEVAASSRVVILQMRHSIISRSQKHS